MIMLITYVQMIHNIPQPSFEQFVARELEKEAEVEIWKGASIVSCQQVRAPCFKLLTQHSFSKGAIRTTQLSRQ